MIDRQEAHAQLDAVLDALDRAARSSDPADAVRAIREFVGMGERCGVSRLLLDASLEYARQRVAYPADTADLPPSENLPYAQIVRAAHLYAVNALDGGILPSEIATEVSADLEDTLRGLPPLLALPRVARNTKKRGANNALRQLILRAHYEAGCTGRSWLKIVRENKKFGLDLTDRAWGQRSADLDKSLPGWTARARTIGARVGLGEDPSADEYEWLQQNVLRHTPDELARVYQQIGRAPRSNLEE